MPFASSGCDLGSANPSLFGVWEKTSGSAHVAVRFKVSTPPLRVSMPSTADHFGAPDKGNTLPWEGQPCRHGNAWPQRSGGAAQSIVSRFPWSALVLVSPLV